MAATLLGVEPGPLLWVATAETLWLRAAFKLKGRGQTLPRRQWWCWHAGMTLWAIGLLSPIHRLSDDLLCMHMAQHLLIADIAAPLLVAGLRTPLLVHYLPKSILVPLARSWIRPLFRFIRKPLVALPIYALVLYSWHFNFMFEAAVKNGYIHALQHASFIGIGMLVWWAALEPKKRKTPGALWKIGHIMATRGVGIFLGVAFVIIRHPVYTNIYGYDHRRWGLTGVQDQQAAGGMMMSVDIIFIASALGYFFYRAAKQNDEDEAAEAAAREKAAALSTT